MAIIVIHDLPESIELDRQAMLAITGGARNRSGGAGRRGPALFRSSLLQDAARLGPGTATGGKTPDRR